MRRLAGRKIGRALVLSCFTGALLGCAEASPEDQPSAGAAAGTPSSMPSTQVEPEETQAQGAEQGTAEAQAVAPETLLEVVSLLNELPRPTTLPDFLQVLPRPLDVYPTRSQFSAQPSMGEENPRIFIFSGQLILSVVPAGDGSPLLEVGELVSDTRSVKAEIPFPLTEDVTPQSMADRVAWRGEGTVCRVCHIDESPADSERFFKGAFESDAIKPNATYDVSIESLRAQWQSCDADEEPDRCAMLDSLFGLGEVRFRQFPQDMRVFF